MFLQSRRNAKAAKVSFKRLLRSNKGEPREIVTDKLRSYNVAHTELIPDVDHNSKQYANNKAELSHQVTRVRERGMRKLKSVTQANRFISAHKEVYNLFNLGRNLIAARHFRDLREGPFASWNRVVAV
jgi:putative transposase